MASHVEMRKIGSIFFPFGFIILIITVEIVSVNCKEVGGAATNSSPDKTLEQNPILNPNEALLNNSNCVISVGEYIYDFSSLEERNFWFYSEISHNDSHLLFLLSICHPVRDVPSCNSGACFSYVNFNNYSDDPKYHENLRNQLDIYNVSYTSGGNLSTLQPEYVKEGNFKQVYEGGGYCIKGNQKRRFKTELHLHCPSSFENESPGPILMSSPNCLFTFVWMTVAACPKLIHKTSDPCIIKFSNSDYPLNLHSLHSPTFYEVRGINSSNYEINICGPINNGSCPINTAICDTTYPKNPVVLATSETVNFNWDDEGLLVLSYKSNSNSYSTNIHLHCDRTAITPRFYFASKAQTSYNFSAYTINVCNPQPSDCVFEDKKLNVYDLRSLHKKEGNYEAIGRDSHDNALFVLNVCGPINAHEGLKCPPGPVGACQASSTAAGSRNIGYITSNPVVNEDGTITLMYTGGQSCGNGLPSSSTRISFVCSNINYPPTFLSVTDSCEHLFEWHTPAACPVNVAFSRDCKVTDPLFGHNFDLSQLRNTSDDYQVVSGSQKFLVNICGPLISPCGGLKGNAAICNLKGNMSIGTAPAELVFNDGTLSMKFEDGAESCGDKKWSTKILFLCTHDEKAPERGLHFFRGDKVSCVHYFTWHTKYACPPHDVTDCFYKDGNVTYDLTPLSDPNVNEVYITYGRVRKYVLNVCRSVVHSKENRCAYDAGACLIDLSHENKTLNLGRVTGGPYVEKGLLKIKYTDGDYCNSTHKYSTIIEFECTDTQYLSFPILYAEEKCLTLFTWSSMYACPQKTLISLDDGSGNCTAVNHLTNYVFDMNFLRSENPRELPIREGATLLINICGSIQNERCPRNSDGACLVVKNSKGTKTTSAGVSNKSLQFHMWSTYLEYRGGSECSNGFSRSTRISFICQEGGSNSGPVFISDDESSCTFFINWYTEAACERHIRCFAHSWNRTYDLSPLVRVWGNYEVSDPSDPDYTYLINVCRPLNPVIGVNCHPGSSSCLVRKSKEPLGLGHPILNPTVVNGDEVHLMYAHGSVCPEEPGFSLSSRIIFICNESAGAGTPEFYKKSGDCQIHFKWETSLICAPSPEEESQCQIAFEAAKTNVDLSPLKREKPYEISYKGGFYMLNLCGGLACDDGSSVCTTDGRSFGKVSQTKLWWEENLLSLVFYGGDACSAGSSGTRTTRIFFECDPSKGLGTPEPDPLMDDLDCRAVFIWKTNLTCVESFYPNSHSPGSLENTTKSQATTAQPTTNIFPATSEPRTESHEDDMSQHTWVSVLIACLVLAGVVAASVYVVGRSSHGRRLYARAKRTLANKGDQTFILDDHL